MREPAPKTPRGAPRRQPREWVLTPSTTYPGYFLTLEGKWDISEGGKRIRVVEVLPAAEAAPEPSSAEGSP